MEELQMLPWAGKVRQFFSEMNQQKKQDLRNGKTACGADLLRHYETRYDMLIAEGKELLAGMEKKSFGCDELRRMVNRLGNYNLKSRENYI